MNTVERKYSCHGAAGIIHEQIMRQDFIQKESAFMKCSSKIIQFSIQVLSMKSSWDYFLGEGGKTSTKSSAFGLSTSL